MLHVDTSELDVVLNATHQADVFGFHDEDLDHEILKDPFSYIEDYQHKLGNVFLTDNGRLGSIDIARMFLLDRAKPIYVALSYDSVQHVLRNADVFHQGYDTSYLHLMGPVPSAINPPEHTAKRSLINRAFGKMAVEAITAELIEPLAVHLSDRIRKQGRADLVTNYTAVLPFVVIAKLMDLPMHLFGQFAEQVRDLMAMGYKPEAGVQAAQDMGKLFSDMYDARVADPQEDLISHLTQAEIEGERLSKDDVVAFCRLLTPAGMETTSRTLANLLVALLTDRRQMDLLRNDMTLVPNAVEEILRWEGPALIMPKITTSATRLEDVDIPKDAYVCVSHGFANRDAKRWDKPHDFDITRERKSNLAFAVGPHTCVGNQLAKKEMEVGLQVLLETIPNLKLDPSKEAPEILGVMMRSPAHVYITH